jgi:hypothetical protein
MTYLSGAELSFALYSAAMMRSIIAVSILHFLSLKVKLLYIISPHHMKGNGRKGVHTYLLFTVTNHYFLLNF